MLQSQNCHDGTSEAPSSLHVFSPVNQGASTRGSTASLDVTVIFASVTSAFANIDGLTGYLLSIVVAAVNSAMSPVNNAAGGLPTILPAGLVTSLLNSMAGSGSTSVVTIALPTVYPVAQVTSVAICATGLISSAVATVTHVAGGAVAKSGSATATLGSVVQSEVRVPQAIASDGGIIASSGVTGLTTAIGNGVAAIARRNLSGLIAAVENIREVANPNEDEKSSSTKSPSQL